MEEREIGTGKIASIVDVNVVRINLTVPPNGHSVVQNHGWSSQCSRSNVAPNDGRSRRSRRNNIDLGIRDNIFCLLPQVMVAASILI